MRLFTRGRAGLWLAVLAVAVLAGCASTPREAAGLSRTLGGDLEALHQSHQRLIDDYFAALRRDVNRAIDDVFVPAYINEFVSSGGLVEAARAGEADHVAAWASVAVEEIEAERRERLAPLNEAEAELSRSVEQAFVRAMRANAAITAHLASQRRAGQARDEALDDIGLGELSERLDAALVAASDRAERITDEIESAAEAF